ncbi:MAG: hypothetical protein AB7O44_19260 [Hyphomicrobiaceae bacterium]
MPGAKKSAGRMVMNWLLGGSEIVAGIALLVGTVMVIALLRPPQGNLQERLIVRFPGAWIIVGLPLTFVMGLSVALIALGINAVR